MSALGAWWHHRTMDHPGTHKELPALPAPKAVAALEAAPQPPAAPLWPHPSIARLQRDIKVMQEIGDKDVRAAYFNQQYGYMTSGRKPQPEAQPEPAKRVLS